MTGFRGRIFATHATLAVMRMVLQDFVRVTTIAADDPTALYDQADIDACLARIEAVDLRQKVTVDGVQFLLLNAGHVLGAAMVLLEIAGVRILYTGDYSCEEDRHLPAAEIPRDFPPNVLIVEATYGMQVHESREQRERRFTEAVETVVRRGGRALIPVFALGRAQELLLVLEEFWAANPHLRSIPIYHASGKLAGKSLEVYRTYLGAMNARVQKQAASDRNPWNFQHVRDVTPSEFRDVGPCVVMAAPGMLQNGFSRQLFDKWCEDPKNGVILTGYSQEGTLARALEMNPLEVESATKRKLARRCAIERISFAAHADSVQTSNFVEALKPGAIVLVHGEKTEMRRLHTSLSRKYEASAGFRGVYMPRNNEAVKFRFYEEKVVRLVGSLADRALAPGARITGLLVHHDFETLLLAPNEVSRFTQLASHALVQKLHVPYRATFAMLKAFVTAMYADTVEAPAVPGGGGAAAGGAGVGGGRSDVPRQCLTVARLVTVSHHPPDRVILSWQASPVADMVAESLLAVIAQAEVSVASVKATSKPCAHCASSSSSSSSSSGGGDGAGAGHEHHHHHHHHGHDHDGSVAESSKLGGEAGAADAAASGDGDGDVAFPTLGAGPVDEDEIEDEGPTADAARVGDVRATTKEEMASAAAWGLAVPWARTILESDSGPFSGPAPPASSPASAAAAAAAASKGIVATLEHVLAPPVKRRRDLLRRMLVDQYGARCVEDASGPEAEEDGGGGMGGGAAAGGFALAVRVGEKSGILAYTPGAGFRVVRAEEGRDDKVRLGAALERAADIVDTVFRPVHALG
jgi:cleavage and polyadenylation specificity factor subunit 3